MNNDACTTDTTSSESMLGKENILLKEQLDYGIIKCHNGSKTLKEIHSRHYEKPKNEGIGFVTKYNENGKFLNPQLYPKTIFFKPKNKGVHVWQCVVMKLLN